MRLRTRSLIQLLPALLVTLGLGVVLQTAAETPAELRARIKPPRPPNIIFILADDLGYGELGCYGQTKIKTPNLDRLAAGGMRFTQCYAGSTVCAPSRAVLMTGRHTGHTPIRGNLNPEMPLRPEDVTVAQVFKSAGYRTGAIGKWGLGVQNTTGTPDRHGFDEWFGYLNQNHAHNYYPTELWRCSLTENLPMRLMSFPKNANGAQGVYSPDLLTMVASNFVRVSSYRPFFLYLAHTIPHANNELKERGMEVPSDEPYSREPWPQPEKNKAAMITRLDRYVGELIRQLRELKIESNTVIFFTSDNGPHKEGGVNPDFFKSSGPFRGIKRDVYEGGIRVPMIVSWPGMIRPGTSDQIFTFWDFLPTAAELAWTNAPAGLDGFSVAPTLLGRKQTNQHDFLYWEFHEQGSKQAVRTGDWKAVRLAPDKALELYDLKMDPGETRNIAAAHQEIVARIETYLKTARTESGQWPLRAAAEAAQTEIQAKEKIP